MFLVLVVDEGGSVCFLLLLGCRWVVLCRLLYGGGLGWWCGSCLGCIW